MIKIKTFKFTICNAASHPMRVDTAEAWYQKKIKEIVSPETIDQTINDFLKDKKFISMNVTPIAEHYHNNARGNTVTALYTIMYEE